MDGRVPKQSKLYGSLQASGLTLRGFLESRGDMATIKVPIREEKLFSCFMTTDTDNDGHEYLVFCPWPDDIMNGAIDNENETILEYPTDLWMK